MIGIAGRAIARSDSVRRRDGDRCAVFGAHVANGAGFDQETCLRSQNRHHSQVCSGALLFAGERSLLKEDYPAMGTGQKCFEAWSAAFGRCTVCRIGIFGFAKVLEFCEWRSF